MKRIFVLLLVVSVFASFLIVPSYASESVSPIIVDLLTSIEYGLYVNGSLIRIENSTSTYQSNVSSVGWHWNLVSNRVYSSVIITVQTSRLPDNLKIGFGYSHNTRNATYLGSIGNFHQYKIDLFDVTGLLTVDGYWNSSYSGDFNLISVFGVLSDTVSFSNVSYFANAMMFDNGGADSDGNNLPSDTDFRWPVSVGSSSNAALPVVVDFSGPTGSDFYTLDYGEVFLKVPFDSTFKYFDSVSFVIYTCGEISSLGARLEHTNGSVVTGLPSDFLYCGETQMIFELQEQFERIHCYIVTVDTKGHDLTDLNLTFQVNIPSVFGSWIYQYDRGFYFQCSSIFGKYDVADIPWYTHFSFWLNKQFNNIVSSLSSVINNVTSAVNNVTSAVESHTYNLWLFWQSLDDRLVTLIVGNGDNQSFENDVADQDQQLNDMQQIMDSVNKPALDSINTDLSGIVSSSDTANIAHVYTMVIGDGFVGQIMTMVVVMAMMSFVLFGKR